MPYSRRTVGLFAAAIAALALLAPTRVGAASCGGMSHDMTLSNGGVSPGSGAVGSTFTFSVTYKDNDGCAPTQIQVRIPGVGTFPLKRASGDLSTGAEFRTARKLPAGTWTYVFEATSGTGVGLRNVTLKSVAPARVVVTQPPPPPTPAPTRLPIATPRPTPTPTPTPTVTPTPGPSSKAHATTPPAASPSAGSTDGTGGPGAAGPAGGASGWADHGDRARLDVGGGIGPASTAPVLRAAELPRPWIALLVASLGALGGLIVFAVLSTRLVDPVPRRPFAASRRRGTPGPPAPASQQ